MEANRAGHEGKRCHMARRASSHAIGLAHPQPPADLVTPRSRPIAEAQSCQDRHTVDAFHASILQRQHIACHANNCAWSMAAAQLAQRLPLLPIGRVPRAAPSPGACCDLPTAAARPMRQCRACSKRLAPCNTQSTYAGRRSSTSSSALPTRGVGLVAARPALPLRLLLCLLAAAAEAAEQQEARAGGFESSGQPCFGQASDRC